MDTIILEELKKVKFTKNYYRANVSGVDQEKTDRLGRCVGNPCLSYTFGLVRPRNKSNLQLSRITQKYMDLYNLLLKYMKQNHPDFVFKSITINKNIICQPHFDKNNKSDSLAVAFGDYTEGGELVVGDVEYNIKNNAIIFNGRNNIHYSKPFSGGDRYSLIFYNL